MGKTHKDMKRLVSPALPCTCQTEPPSSYATTNRRVWRFGYFQGVTAAASEVRDSWLTGTGRVPEGAANSEGIIIKIFFWDQVHKEMCVFAEDKDEGNWRRKLVSEGRRQQAGDTFQQSIWCEMNPEGSTPVGQGKAGARPPLS